jgi:hypothetical protein
MKPIKLFFIATLLFTGVANAQITKGNWMVGGNVSFAYSTNDTNSNSTIILSPNIGYFIIDKLALGSVLNYNYSKSKNDSGTGLYKSSNLGPFIRYYVLNEEKKVNVFFETSYNFNLQKGDFKNDVFGAKAATVFFLNSSVGLEVSLNYSLNKYKYPNGSIPDGSSNSLLLGLALQIHLEKEE